MQTIYIGPSIKALDLRRNRIYLEYPAEKIATLKGQYSLIERLFISVSELNAGQKALETKGTPINKAAAQLKGAI